MAKYATLLAILATGILGQPATPDANTLSECKFFLEGDGYAATARESCIGTVPVSSSGQAVMWESCKNEGIKKQACDELLKINTEEKAKQECSQEIRDLDLGSLEDICNKKVVLDHIVQATLIGSCGPQGPIARVCSSS